MNNFYRSCIFELWNSSVEIHHFPYNYLLSTAIQGTPAIYCSVYTIYGSFHLAIDFPIIHALIHKRFNSFRINNEWQMKIGCDTLALMLCYRCLIQKLKREMAFDWHNVKSMKSKFVNVWLKFHTSHKISAAVPVTMRNVYLTLR